MSILFHTDDCGDGFMQCMPNLLYFVHPRGITRQEQQDKFRFFSQSLIGFLTAMNDVIVDD